MKKILSFILLSAIMSALLLGFISCTEEVPTNQTTEPKKSLYESLPPERKNVVDCFIGWFVNGAGKVRYPETIRINEVYSADGGTLALVQFSQKDMYGAEQESKYILVTQESKWLQELGAKSKKEAAESVKDYDKEHKDDLAQSYYAVATKGTVIRIVDVEAFDMGELVNCPGGEVPNIRVPEHLIYDRIAVVDTRDKVYVSPYILTQIIQEYVYQHGLSSGIFG